MVGEIYGTFTCPCHTPSQDNSDLEAHIPSVGFWSLIPEREEQTLLEIILTCLGATWKTDIKCLSILTNSEHRLEKCQAMLGNTARWTNILHTHGAKDYWLKDMTDYLKSRSKSQGDSLGNEDIKKHLCI